MLAPKHKEREAEPFVETPHGIFTKDGIWFHTTMKLLDKYARELWTVRSKKELIMAASNQIKSVDVVGILALCVSTISINVWAALPLTAVAMILYRVLLPTIASHGFSRLLKPFHNDILLIILGVVAFSSLGMNQEYVELTVVLAAFLVLKFGWIGSYIQTQKERSAASHTFNDRVLKMIIIKECMHNGIATHEIERMESEILDILNKKNTTKK